MLNLLTYKGFVAQIEYDPVTDCIVGEVVNAQDVLLFEGRDLAQLKRRMSEVIDEYCKFTQDQNNPEAISPFVGRFVVCLTPDDQLRLFKAAERESIGVNHWLNREVRYLIHRLTC
jgi:predicted HicB family RNase H-like nuclease